MPTVSESVSKWISLSLSAIGVLISLGIAVGVVFVMRNDIEHNTAAINKLERLTAFAERITALETTSAAHSRDIVDLGSYEWLLKNLDHRLGVVEGRTEDTVRDDWVGWRSRVDSRLGALERSQRP